MRHNWILTTALAFTIGAGAWVAQGEGENGEQKAAEETSVSVTVSPLDQKRKYGRRGPKKRWDGVLFRTANPVATKSETTQAAPSTTIIEYDNNVAVRRSSNTNTVVIGNQFDVGGGGNPIGGPWTITGFIAQNAGPAYGTTSPTATVVFFNGPGAGTQAAVLGVIYVTLTGGVQTFNLATPLTGTGSFLGGVVNSSYTGCAVSSVPPATTCDGVALDTAENSTNPLGFHAMSIAAFAIPGTGFATIPGQNAIFKVTGSSLPIELMKFSVD